MYVPKKGFLHCKNNKDNDRTTTRFDFDFAFFLYFCFLRPSFLGHSLYLLPLSKNLISTNRRKLFHTPFLSAPYPTPTHHLH